MGFIEDLKRRNEKQEELVRKESDLRRQAEQEIAERRRQALDAYNEGSISVIFKELYRDRSQGRPFGEASLKIHEQRGGYWDKSRKRYSDTDDSDWVIGVELRWDEGINRGYTAIGCQFYPDGSTVIWGQSREKIPKASLQNTNVVEGAVKRAFENPHKVEKSPVGRGSPLPGDQPGSGGY